MDNQSKKCYNLHLFGDTYDFNYFDCINNMYNINIINLILSKNKNKEVFYRLLLGYILGWSGTDDCDIESIIR